MALATLEVARLEFGLKVPEELAIVGYDNSEPAHWPFYGLTSIDQNLEEMARIAIALLIDKLEGRQVGVAHVVVPGILMQRSTTRLIS